VGFVVDNVAVGQVTVRVLVFSPVSVIPPLLHIHLSIIWGVDNGPVSGPVSQKHSHAPKDNEGNNIFLVSFGSRYNDLLSHVL
jgi:hypothetical protein